jgi:ABC-type Fe3+ transport system permease subunit
MSPNISPLEVIIYAFQFVISFENPVVSILAILLIGSAVLHMYLTFTSEKYRSKSTKTYENSFISAPSFDHLKLAVVGFSIIGLCVFIISIWS